MNRDTIYFKQVQLLIRVLPLVATEQCFALNIRIFLIVTLNQFSLFFSRLFSLCRRHFFLVSFDEG